MWRLYLCKFLLNIRFNCELLERVRGSARLREFCGFGDSIPSESALSRFASRLADHRDLVEKCLERATVELRDLLSKLKSRKGGKSLPPLGAVMAVDSTVFDTYANPNRTVPTDPDARWGVKHTGRAKDGKTDYRFGYKLHMVSDAVYGVPLGFKVTPANRNDSLELGPVFRQTLKTHSWLKPKYVLADRGYDSQGNHELLYGRDVVSIIHMRRSSTSDGLYDM